MKKCLLLSIILAGLLISPFFGVGINAQKSVVIFPFKDNSIFSEDNSLSNGAGIYIFTGRTDKLAIRRALVQFNFEGIIPTNAEVDSVNLTLSLSITKTPTGRQVNLHKLNSIWGEAGSDAAGEEGKGIAAQAGDATWLYSEFSTQTWVNPGGDFEANSSAGQIVADIGNYTWRGAGMTEDVKSWLNDPDNNHGWIIIGAEENQGSAKRFNSRENSNTDTRPKLLVYYTEPLAIPGVKLSSLEKAVISPNPFRDQVSIEYVLGRESEVLLKIYNILGKEIKTLVDGFQPAGNQKVLWDGNDATGSPVKQGMYYAIIISGQEKEIFKIIKSQ